MANNSPEPPKTPTKPEIQTKVIETTDGTVRISNPKGKHRGITVLLDSDDIVREQVGGFANFLRDYAVVGLAIGFVVGQQANTVVKQLVDSFVKPWVEVLFGDDLSNRAFTLHHGSTPVHFPWGAFLYVLVEFFVVVVGIYVVVKLFRLDRLKQPKEAAKKKKP
jgi:large conductance mechanosensitive channel